MPQSRSLLTSEAEAVKYGLGTRSPGPQLPGPGSYDPFTEEMSTINYNLTSIEGSFPKETRGMSKSLSRGQSPGPIYDTAGSLGQGVPAAAIPRAKRFDDSITRGPGYHEGIRRREKPGSYDGTFAKASRDTLGPLTPSPGPCYNTRKSMQKGTRNSTMPKAERWPVPEEEESPGPIYMPKKSALTGPVAKIGYGRRFSRKEKDSLGPGPVTATPDIGANQLKNPPAYSIRGRLKERPKEEVPGFIYHPKDEPRSNPPAYSFAAPDPQRLAIMRQQKSLPARGAIPKPNSTKRLLGEREKAEEPVDSASNEDAEQSPEDMEENEAEAENPTPSSAKVKHAEHHASVLRDAMKDGQGSGPRAPPKTMTTTAAAGHETPGPAHYMNIYKLFENRPGAKAATMGGRYDSSPQKPTPGPGHYSPPRDTRGMSKPKPGTFGTAKRDTFRSKSVSPGPVYSNEKWTKKTPIRHGVATQTTNYTAKAEARARAERDAKQQQHLKKQMAALQNDTLPCDDEFYDYTPTRLDDVTTTTKDRFLMNVWY